VPVRALAQEVSGNRVILWNMGRIS
jgi:hypothetical protein